MNPTIIYALIRWVATVLGSTALGVWLTSHITPELIETLYSNATAIVGGIVAILAIIESLIEKSKAAKK